MIRVVIKDERGNAVGEGVDVETDVLVHVDDLRFTCLRFVDPYGNTVFNTYQFTPLLEDLRLLRQLYDVKEHEGALQQVEALVRQCQAGVHMYLWLIGD